MSDTGESTRSIVSRTNLTGWRLVLPMMERGADLKRHHRTNRYYVDGWGSLTPEFVAKLERDGTIVRSGADSYRLAPGNGASVQQSSPER